jgi:hypothetical protein
VPGKRAVATARFSAAVGPYDLTEVEHAIEVRRTRPQDKIFAVTSPGDVLGDAAWRIYRAVPVAVYKYHDAAEIVHGQHVDVRVKVTLQPSG